MRCSAPVDTNSIFVKVRVNSWNNPYGVKLMNNIQKLAELGQSIWIDNIQRKMLTGGGLQAMIDEGLLGMTSNPTIFEKAIGSSSDYDEAMRPLIDHMRGGTNL